MRPKLRFVEAFHFGDDLAGASSRELAEVVDHMHLIVITQAISNIGSKNDPES